MSPEEPSVVSRMPLANARGSEAPILSRDREGADVKSYAGHHTSILFRGTTPGVSRRDIRAFAERLESAVAGGRAFCCVVTSDRELRRLNRDFRKKDYPTDVLSFPAIQPNGFLGEIAISFPRARDQANQYGHEVGQEIEILMLHGLLHLLGMDHESDRGRMARAERKWRAALGLPHGLIERVRQ
jgi:probable rRNA maturation factor